jgi:non-ribosomal peptide synthetase component E (peptide arylation enzyme)
VRLLDTLFRAGIESPQSLATTDGTRRLSFLMLSREMERLSAELSRLGTRKHDVVLLPSGDSVAALVRAHAGSGCALMV